MKALMVAHEGSYLPHHSLTKLAKECEPFGDYFSLDSTKEGLEVFEHYEQIGRYGGAAKKDKIRVDTPEIQIRGAHQWTGNHIHVLDELVKNIRGLIPVEPRYVDAIKGIIAGKDGLLLSESWRGTESIRDVLLRDNFSFD